MSEQGEREKMMIHPTFTFTVFLTSLLLSPRIIRLLFTLIFLSLIHTAHQDV